MLTELTLKSGEREEKKKKKPDPENNFWVPISSCSHTHPKQYARVHLRRGYGFWFLKAQR